MTSEDEISIQGSPSVTRRRLGSFNGQSGATNSASGKEERSPGWCFFFFSFLQHIGYI